MIAWFLQHRCRLLKHVEKKKPVQYPFPAWWIMCAAVPPLFKSLQLTFSNLQAKELVISPQAEEIDHLVCKPCAIGIKHVNTDLPHEKL
jgi:hypothetical protein